MKSYPSIPLAGDFAHPWFVFDKLDGSNVRAEWSPKRGFYKFGSRTQLLTPDQAPLWPVVARLQGLEARLRPSLEKLRAERAVCFFEWVGPHSFAGSHSDPAEAMGLFLLDVDVYKRGRLDPPSVMDLAARSGVPTPALLHTGRIDQDFLQAVRESRWPGVTFEGVVGKGPLDRTAGGPRMFKCKSHAWLARLKQHCGDDEALFQRLA